jgi:uncharacterized protein
MPRLNDILRIRGELLDVARRHKATGLAVFGSVARSTESGGSDVDFLVTCGPGMSLLDLQALHDELVQRLRSPVDLVSARALSPRVRELVLRDAVSL